MNACHSVSLGQRGVVSLIACAGSVLTLLPACRENTSKPRPVQDNPPFVFLRVDSGMPVPGQPHRAGTLVALWDDGTLVRAVSDQQVGESYVQGRIGPDQVEAVRSTIDETGILSAKSKGLILDASAIELTIRGENGVQTWGCSPGTPQHDERIIAIQEKLMSLPLSDETSVDAAAYKGYPHDWFK